MTAREYCSIFTGMHIMNNKKTLRLLNFNLVAILICIMAQSTHAADWKRTWPHPQLPDSDDEIFLEENKEIIPSRTPRVYVAPHMQIEPVMAEIMDIYEEAIEEKEEFMPPQIPDEYPANHMQIKEEYDWDLLALGQENFDNFLSSTPSIPQLPQPVPSQCNKAMVRPQDYPAHAAPQYPAFNAPPQLKAPAQTNNLTFQQENYPAPAALQYPAFNAPPQYYVPAQGNNLMFQPGNYPIFAVPQYSVPVSPSVGHNPVVYHQHNYVTNTYVLAGPGANHIQNFNFPPTAQDEVQGNGKRKNHESNSEKMKRRKTNIATRKKNSIKTGELFEELSKCIYKNPVNVPNKITFETKKATWYLDISAFEDSILSLAPQKNREFLKDLKKHCQARGCKENIKSRDLRKIYINALNNGIHYKITPELMNFIDENYIDNDPNYGKFFRQFCQGAVNNKYNTFIISPWDPILTILETTNFGKRKNTRVNELLYNESLLKAFQEGSHLKAHRQIMNSVLVLRNFLYGDAINIIIELMVMLHADPETYVFEGDNN